MKLDKRNRQLLGVLQNEARLPLTIIGKRLGLSKESVGYRIKQLVNKKLITSFSVTTNGALLGYRYHKILIKFSRVTPSEEDDIIDYLLSTPGVTIIREMEGLYDLSFVYMSTSFRKLRDFLSIFTKLHGDQIIKRHILFLNKIHNYTHSYFMLDDKNKKNTIYSLLQKDNIVLDSIDKELLKGLSKDGDINIVKLANNLEIKRTTLLYHKRKLEDEGVIVSYNSHINFIKLKLICVHINLALFNISETSEVISFFENLGVCNLVYEVIGEYDLSIELFFESNSEKRDVLRQFKNRFTKRILQYDITDVPNTYDVGWSPFLSASNN